MRMNKYSHILKMLSDAPEGQIDKQICYKLSILAQKEDTCSQDVLDILDQCAYTALASDFAMQAMNTIWKQMLSDEGVSVQEALEAQAKRHQAI